MATPSRFHWYVIARLLTAATDSSVPEPAMTDWDSVSEEIAGGASTATEATSLKTLPVGFVTTTWYSPADAPLRFDKLRDAEVAPAMASPSCIHWYVIGSEPIADTTSATLPPRTPRVSAGCV